MNINLYRRRRLRSTQPILTRVQIRDLGRKIGFTSFRQSVEFLMDPYNYFKLSKVRMTDIHNYLLEQDITQERCPNTHIRQGDHSRVLISILFPGYLIVKASEQHYRDLRENRSPQAKLIDLAYDQLPTTDKYERLEELFRTEVDWYKQDENSKQYSLEIPLKKLNRSIVVEGHSSSNINVRLFLYLWSSERMSWNPTDISLNVDSNKNCLSEDDKKFNGFGFDHIDITEKSDAITKANRRSTGSTTLKFTFHKKRPTIHHVSVCAVIERSPEELASQLYVQTASLYIGQAMEASSKNVPAAQAVQQKVLDILKPYDQNDRLVVQKTENLFLSCAETFASAWDEHNEEVNEDDDDIEVYTGGEYISLLDPIVLTRIEHPARCIFCKHKACFDAKAFFKFQVTSMRWKCPICAVKIRGIQDLYIDYKIKASLIAYPDDERLSLENDGTYLPIPPIEISRVPEKRSYAEIILLDDEDAESPSKRAKASNI